jgi:hypothetical protein
MTKRNSWKILCGVFIGTPLLGLVLVNLPKIQADAVSATEAASAQVFSRKSYTPIYPGGDSLPDGR